MFAADFIMSSTPFTHTQFCSRLSYLELCPKGSTQLQKIFLQMFLFAKSEYCVRSWFYLAENLMWLIKVTAGSKACSDLYHSIESPDMAVFL